MHNNGVIQQGVLTLVAMYMNESMNKSLPEKKLLPKLVSIYDSTNVPCRAKAYLLTYILIKQQDELLLQLIQSK